MARISEPVQTYLPDTQPSLAELLQEDLSFRGTSPQHKTHNTHAFAAKFPPQLPELFIERLTSPGDVVLDPMAGSGTALVESARLGRTGLGTDIDPLAAIICDAKTRPLDPERAAELGAQIVDHASLVLANEGSSYASNVLDRFDQATQDFIQYWFLPDTIAELGALRRSIEAIVDPEYETLFDMIFSSIIVTKSGGVSRARDLAHSRPHRVEGKRIRDAIPFFAEKAKNAIATLHELRSFPGESHVLRGDSRALPLRSDSADLVVTSPPYANAIDYVRAHKFSLVWLGTPISRLTDIRRTYIGAEVRWYGDHEQLSETGLSTIRRIAQKDIRRSLIVQRYFLEMTESLREMHRVLKPGKPAIVVVGSSTVRGVHVHTGLILAEIGEKIGFNLAGLKEREIDRDRRLMPISKVSSQAGIEARMHNEEVIAFVKPD